MPVKKEGIAWDYLSPLEKAQLLHFHPEIKPGRIYEIVHEGKALHKYQIWHKGILQGWVVGESPEDICRLYGWDIGDCEFKREPFSCWDIGK